MEQLCSIHRGSDAAALLNLMKQECFQVSFPASSYPPTRITTALDHILSPVGRGVSGWLWQDGRRDVEVLNNTEPERALGPDSVWQEPHPSCELEANRSYGLTKQAGPATLRKRFSKTCGLSNSAR